jgi:hypothetical protein
MSSGYIWDEWSDPEDNNGGEIASRSSNFERQNSRNTVNQNSTKSNIREDEVSFDSNIYEVRNVRNSQPLNVVPPYESLEAIPTALGSAATSSAPPSYRSIERFTVATPTPPRPPSVGPSPVSSRIVSGSSYGRNTPNRSSSSTRQLTQREVAGSSSSVGTGLTERRNTLETLEKVSFTFKQQLQCFIFFNESLMIGVRQL